MATGKQNDKGLKQNEVVERLIPDPDQPPDLTLLIGFLGKSVQEGHWRLYVTPELTAWFEFAEEDVVRSEPFGAAERTSALNATSVWVRREATLRFTQAVSAKGQGEFLQGDITSRFLSESSLQGLQGAELIGTIIRVTSRIVCTRVLCSQLCSGVCPTGATICMTCLNCNA